MHKIVALSIAVLAALMAGAGWGGTAFAADQPGITGKVVNTTASGGSVAGLEVVLTPYVNTAPSAPQKTVTDADGNFVFTGLSTDASYSYKASVKYKNVEYTSDPFQLTASNPAQTVTLHVYETTNSDEAIKLTTGHAVVFPEAQGMLTMLEVWAITNSGDRTYVGPAGQGTPATAHFTLPAGATNLSGDGFTLDTATGVATYAAPIIPGTSYASYTYVLLYQSDSVVISHKIDYAIPSFGILVPQQGVTATSTTLTQSTPQNVQGTNYLYLSGAGLKSGQDIDISLTISPQAYAAAASSTGTPSSGTASWQWFVVGAVAIAVVAGLAYLALRRRDVPVKAGTGVVGEADVEEEALLEQMARLDQEFDDGHLAETEYRERRRQAKARLIYLRSKGGHPRGGEGL